MSSQEDQQPADLVEQKFFIDSLQPGDGREADLDQFILVSHRREEPLAKNRVVRSGLDFQFLEQQLFRCGQNLDGYIVPPFPKDAELAASSGKSEELTNGSGAIKQTLPIQSGSVILADERQLYHWLRMVLQHPVFGRSGPLQSFLTERTLPPPGRITKSIGFIKSIQDTIDSRKHSHKDCDPFFQKERDWSSQVIDLMQENCTVFEATNQARFSLGQCQAHLAAALSVPLGDNDDPVNRLVLDSCLCLSRALDCSREILEEESSRGAASLGAILLFWSRYMKSEREMLKRRSCLLVELESITRQCDKVRYQRQPELEEQKANAERAFESCSKIARAEIQRFQVDRRKDLGKALAEYKESQLQLAKQYYERLSSICKSFPTA